MKVIIVGRNSDCDFIVNDVKVSRKHLQIIINDSGEYSVVDLGSMNGTFVNGNRIKGEVKLHRGDVIKIGNTDLPWKDIVKRQDSDPLPKKSKKWIIYVFAALVIVLLSVIVGIVINDHRNSKEPEKNKEYPESLESRANEEYTNNLRTYNNSLEVAIRKQKEDAINAKRNKEKADQKIEAVKKEKNEAIIRAQQTAEREKDSLKTILNQKIEAVEEEKNKAIKAQQTAEKKLEQNKLDLLQYSYKSVIEESEKLQRKYYSSNNFKQYVPCIYQEVLEQYGNTTIEEGKSFVNDTTDTLKLRIDKEFDKADLEHKQKIIEIIESVNEEAKKLQEYFDDHFTELTEEGYIEVYNKIKENKKESFTIALHTTALQGQIKYYFKYSSIKEKNKVNNAIKAVLEANAVKK